MDLTSNVWGRERVPKVCTVIQSRCRDAERSAWKVPESKKKNGCPPAHMRIRLGDERERERVGLVFWIRVAHSSVCFILCFHSSVHGCTTVGFCSAHFVWSGLSRKFGI
mmetsp:Transcript_1742/g.3619  ORF Transcript_1742/g.3619 Transcript_1742/m.3619 type:complete len:109 (+) Transcript_1742:78-404(+)